LETLGMPVPRPNARDLVTGRIAIRPTSNARTRHMLARAKFLAAVWREADRFSFAPDEDVRAQMILPAMAGRLMSDG